MVRAIMIVEVAGRPQEHVKEALEKHVDVLNKFKDIQVHKIEASDPREIQEGSGVFTCFSEVDFEVDNFARLTEVMFDFMPSSVEVIEPPTINMNSQEATNLLNNISGRMHKYDKVAVAAQGKIRAITREASKMQQLLIDNKILKIEGDKAVPYDKKPKKEEKNQKKTKKQKKPKKKKS